MAKYYVNKRAQVNGDHEVHVEGCNHMPSSENQLYLGNFNDCHAAVKEAKKHYAKSNGCYWCSNPCHTS